MVIKDPAWTRKPGFAEHRRAFPGQALGGGASPVCRVTATGTLADCVVWLEKPTGQGYGEAALKLMSAYAMAATLADGTPTAGGYVVVPAYFDLDRPAPVVTMSTLRPGERVVPEPNWTRVPSGDDLSRYYPSRALGPMW